MAGFANPNAYYIGNEALAGLEINDLEVCWGGKDSNGGAPCVATPQALNAHPLVAVTRALASCHDIK